MKKKLLAMLLVLCMLTFCTVTALAAPTEITPTPAESKTYNVEYTTAEGVANEGKQYVLLIVRAPKGATLGQETALGELDVNSILYIDQAGADAAGKVTFTGLQLKSQTSANVYIAGETLEAPVHMGYIEVAGVSAGGTIKFHGNTSTATVKLLNPADQTEAASVETGTDGAYEFETVPAGEYLMKVVKAGYADAQKAVEVTGDSLGEFSIEKYAGDIVKNGSINFFDLQKLLPDYDREGNDIVDQATDLNGNGSTNFFDLQILLANYDTTPTEG